MRRIRAAIGETTRDANSAARLPLRVQTAAGHVGTESPSNLANCSSLRIRILLRGQPAASGREILQATPTPVLNLLGSDSASICRRGVQTARPRHRPGRCNRQAMRYYVDAAVLLVVEGLVYCRDLDRG